MTCKVTLKVTCTYSEPQGDPKGNLIGNLQIVTLSDLQGGLQDLQGHSSVLVADKERHAKSFIT